MKVNNLLKKVGSVITTAALLATLGTTAFADGDVTVGVGGDGISITNVNTVQRENSTDVYDVTVTYKTTKDNAVGMTMLVYKNTDNSNLDVKTVSGADNSYKDTSMQIIGIDQSAKLSGSDASAKEGTFTFSVTTNEGTKAAPNAYYIKKGKKALIAVSGDKCKPAYAPLLLKATAQSANNVTVSEPVHVDANATDEQIKTELDKVVPTQVTITDDVSGEHYVDISLADEASEWASSDGKTYTKTYTFKAENKNVEDVDFSKDITVTITATLEKDAIEGTVTKLGSQPVNKGDDDKLSATISVNASVFDGAESGKELEKLTQYLNDNYAKVTLAAGDLTDTIADGAKFSTTEKTYSSTQNTYSYAADVETYTGEKLKLASGVQIGVTVNITNDSITNVKLTKDNDEVTGELGSVQVPTGTADDNIASAVMEKLSAYSLSYAENKNGVDTPNKTIALNDNKVGYTSKVESDKVTFTIATIDKIALATPFEVVVPYTIAPAFVYGDVNGDKLINLKDALLILNHIKGDELSEAQKLAADVDEPYSLINLKDALSILKHIKDSSYEFPVLSK